MDFMKAFDQAVREIKREVNLKVFKVPEIEQKVLDATDNEPWGPHGTVLAEIAEATKKFTECQMVMNVLWTRLTETDKNWRLVYKALAVIEYLVAHGSECAVDDIIEHTFQISSLASFEYVEASGKDLGMNVRRKAETIVALLNDSDKVEEVRKKAAATRDKYFGFSSSGTTYKSGAASFSSGNFWNNGRYRGFGNTEDGETFKDSYSDEDQYDDDRYKKITRSKKEPSFYGSKEQEPLATGASKTARKTSESYAYASVSSQNEPPDEYDDDFDPRATSDFDPRGTSTSKSSTGGNQVGLFKQNSVDLLDAPMSPPTNNSTSADNDQPKVDLFADVNFASATPEPKAEKSLVPRTSPALFDSQPASAPSTTMDLFAASDPVSHPAPALSTTVDLFATSDPVSHPSPALPTTIDLLTASDAVSQPDNKAPKSETTSNTADPFAAVPLNNFDGSNTLGTFTSHTEPLPTPPNQNSPNSGSQRNINEFSSVETKPKPKKEAFQIYSGVWADSLSRGLIDLNITAPKKVNLADIGIVGGRTDGPVEKGKGHAPPFHMGRSMSIGSGAGKSAFTSTPKSTSNDFFSSPTSQQYQFGGFQK